MVLFMTMSVMERQTPVHACRVELLLWIRVATEKPELVCCDRWGCYADCVCVCDSSLGLLLIN